jgi:hypothetical protein
VNLQNNDQWVWTYNVSPVVDAYMNEYESQKAKISSINTIDATKDKKISDFEAKVSHLQSIVSK